MERTMRYVWIVSRVITLHFPYSFIMLFINEWTFQYACEDLESVIDEWRRVVSPLPRLVNQVIY